jgi:ferredoxin
MPRLEVDAARCTGHGRCYTDAPNLLSDDEEGFVTARGETVDVPAERLDEARAAAQSCPEQAITLHESP